jgi:ribosomal-protein-alanine N-acetyltransferase
MKFEIQTAQETDLDALTEIAREASPWTRESFLGEWQNPMSHTRVLRLASRDIVAFYTYWHVIDELHLLNIATHTAHRRQGYARVLLEELIAYMQQSNCQHIFLEVRKGNTAAQQLYFSLGFQKVGERARYYDDSEDAVLLSLFARH